MRPGRYLEAFLPLSVTPVSILTREADRFFSTAPVTYGDLTDLTTTPVRPCPLPVSLSLSLFWSLFRVATPADKNRGRTVRIDDRPPRGTHDVRGDRSLSSSPVAGDEPRRRRRRRQRPRGAHTEARFHLAECIKPDVVLANGTK